MTEIDWAILALVLAIATLVVQHVLLRRAEAIADLATDAIIAVAKGELRVVLSGNDIHFKPTNKSGD